MSTTESFVSILGRNIQLVEDRNLQRVVARIAEMPRQRVLFCNVHMLMLSQEDAELATAMAEANWVFADGVPVAWLQRRLTGKRVQVVRGHEILQAVCARAATCGERVGFLGSTTEVQGKLAAKLRDRHPGLTIAFQSAPPFTQVETILGIQEQAEIEIAGLHWLFVGLGCPKQEKWIAAHASRLGCHTLAVGAAFDWLAGTVLKPPALMERTGLGWLFRLLQNPLRLWRRYLIFNTKFVLAVTRLLVLDKVFGKSAPHLDR